MAVQRLYISHSPQDNPWCRIFVAALQSTGFATWFDEGSPAAGATWIATQEQAISSCDIVILVVSPDALASPWVQHEYAVAVTAQRHIGPIVIQPATVPYDLQQLQPLYCVGQHPLQAAQLLADKITAPLSEQPYYQYSAEQLSNPQPSSYPRSSPAYQTRSTLEGEPMPSFSPKEPYARSAALHPARPKPAFSWSVVLGGGASLATIIGVVLTLLTTKPFGLFAPAPAPTAVPITYHAAIPGVSCDAGSGKWINQIGSAATHVFGTVACNPHGLKVTSLAGYSNEAPQVVFEWPNHQFSTTYTTETDITPQTANGCGGVITHGQSLDLPGEYIFLICPNGMWKIMVAAKTDGSFNELKSGQVSMQTTYHLQVKVDGSTYTLQINANDHVSVTDTTYTSTSFVGLIVSGYPSEDDEAATFANFTYSGTR